ncbi:MAG: class I SAM-dependent methyltransferase [Pirellulales bacterium]
MGTFQEMADAEAREIAAWEDRVESLIRDKGGSATAREFQRAVNVVFHNVEAGCYDRIHQEMWLSLPPVFDRVVADIQQHCQPATDRTLADVGCGTGLATELLLETPLGSRFAALLMVDTSEEMLRRCRKRAANWHRATEFIHGQIEALPDASVDAVITCSVLHHLPDLFEFCRQLARVLRRNGLYVHVHDPRRGAIHQPAVMQRMEELASYRWRRRTRFWMLPFRIARVVLNRTRRAISSDYLDDVNQRLIDAGLIKVPLTPNEIWSITDLRMGNLPYSAVDGVGSDELKSALVEFESISMHTYGYYGVLPSNLPPGFAAKERTLFAESCPDGMFIAGAWRKLNNP